MNFVPLTLGKEFVMPLKGNGKVATSAEAKQLGRFYTSRGHKLRLLKELKMQGSQRIEIRLVSCHDFVQAI